MIDRKKDGTRSIGLYCPISPAPGVSLASIELRPVTLDDVFRWQAGKIAGPMAFLAELAGLTEDTLGLLQYPDAEIVLQEFSIHLPAAIRLEVVGASVPKHDAAGGEPPVDEAPVEQWPAHVEPAPSEFDGAADPALFAAE